MAIRAELRDEATERRLEVRGLTWEGRRIENVYLSWQRMWNGWELARVDLEVTHPSDPDSWAVVRRFDHDELTAGALPGELRKLAEGFVPQPLGLDGLFRRVTV